MMNIQYNYAKQLGALMSRVRPSAISNPQLRIINHSLIEQFDLGQSSPYEEFLLTQLFADNGSLSQNAVAQKYGGHQFGQWNPHLGDGRGLLLAEVVDKSGTRHDWHLKGAGQTPYSRLGDGRAVLRSTIREYLASEALHHLGIPSSRALCLFDSDEPVQREQLETAAMLIRTSPSHIRFGHFEYFYHSGQKDHLDALFDFCLQHHFDHCQTQQHPKLAMLEEIVISTAKLIAKWQAYGFNHGVMNTDNMSIHGITFDYGPFAFLDDFEPGYICNQSDHQGRYAFDNQPAIGLWNLNALAHGFAAYLQIDQLKQALSLYQPTLQQHYTALMLTRLGLEQDCRNGQQIVNQWLSLLTAEKADYNASFRLLSEFQLTGDNCQLMAHFIDRQRFNQWAELYASARREARKTQDQINQQMRRVNPRFVLRNHLLQAVIEQAQQGDYTGFKQLNQVISAPFDEHPEYPHLAKPPAAESKGVALSCSS